MQSTATPCTPAGTADGGAGCRGPTHSWVLCI